MKPKHQRLVFVCVSVVFLCVSALLVMRAFRDNLVFFYSPSELAAKPSDPARMIRIGGLVSLHSLVHDSEDRIHFELTDGKTAITVSYRGILPSLFREGQGVVAEGYAEDKTHLRAVTILAKHDETYMPREVVEALKKSGHWQGETGNR